MTQPTSSRREASGAERYLRTEFLRCVAHGLRSPLTVAKGALAEMPGSAPDEVEFLTAMVQRSLQRITQLAQQLDWLSELQGEPLVAQRQPCVVSALLSEAQQATDLSKLQVVTDLEPDLQIDADRMLLLRALGALLDNARRFGKEKLRIRTAALENGGVSICIEDDGPGVAESRHATLFDPFIAAKARGADTDLALGLPLAQAYVELHGGRIQLATSELGGLLCRILLPVGVGQEPA